MNIQSTPQQNTFKGYDARNLKGFLMSTNCNGIADEMMHIGRKEGFKIFSASTPCYEGVPRYTSIEETRDMWAQDYWTFVQDSIVSLKDDFQSSFIGQYFNHQANPIQNNLRNNPEYKQAASEATQHSTPYHEATIRLNQMNKNTHISGGNIFIVKGDENDEIIVGADELKKFSIEDIKKMYSVDKVCVLPQMDYHLDLFIRPLDNKRILLADDNMTLDILKKIKLNFKQPNKTNCSEKEMNTYKWAKSKVDNIHSDFQEQVDKNPLPTADDVASVLEEHGFKVIRVPARLYRVCHDPYRKQTLLSHNLNYMNANVIKNSDGDIVYITNKSNFDRRHNLDNEQFNSPNNTFENAFISSISPYIQRNHTYFVQGKNDFVADEMLSRHMGGIHCAATEIP